MKSQDLEKQCPFFAFFGKMSPYEEFLQNSVPKGFIATPIDVLCYGGPSHWAFAHILVE